MIPKVLRPSDIYEKKALGLKGELRGAAEVSPRASFSGPRDIERIMSHPFNPKGQAKSSDLTTWDPQMF